MSSVFTVYESKQLSNIIENVTRASYMTCLGLCINTKGCYAVNINYNGNYVCGLTTGLRSQNEMLDSPGSLYIMGKL